MRTIGEFVILLIDHWPVLLLGAGVSCFAWLLTVLQGRYDDWSVARQLAKAQYDEVCEKLRGKYLTMGNAVWACQRLREIKKEYGKSYTLTLPVAGDVPATITLSG
jgi:hypothetical protein